MKMKLTLLAVGALGLGVNGIAKAQQDQVKEDLRVKKHTLMARFEPGYVPPAEERLELKLHRKETVQYRAALIDTLSIPERKKRKLRRELYNTPFTEEWEKVIADLDLEPDPEEP